MYLEEEQNYSITWGIQNGIGNPTEDTFHSHLLRIYIDCIELSLSK